MFEQLINHFFKYEFVYVFIFVALSFLLLAIIVNKQILKISFILLFSVFFSIFAIEFFLSLKMLPLNNNSQKHYTTHIFDESIDFSKLVRKKRLRYNENGQEYLFWNTDFIKKDKDNRIFVYNVYETTYQNGFRYTECDFDAEKNYVFLGCSFMYGLGVNDNQTLPYLFYKLSKFKIGVLNCGFPATGSNSALNIVQNNVVRKFIKQDKKIEKFIYLFIFDHIRRNFRNEFEKDIPGDNYIYEKGKFIGIKQPFGIFINNLEHSYIFRKFFLNLIEDKNKMFYEKYFINSLIKMNNIVENQYGSRLTIVLWMGANKGFDENSIKKLKNTNLDILMLPEFDDNYVIPHDGHPNEKANREIAELLLKHFEEQDKKHEK